MIISNEEFLNQVSSEVSESEWTETQEKLLAAVREKKVAETAVGLAAVQIGILQRIFITYNSEKNVWTTWVNPRIEEQEPEQIEVVESCLSFPRRAVLTKRYKQILVSSQNLEDWNADRPKFVLYDEEAVVFQHEYDHLDGILMFKRGEEIFVKPVKVEKLPGRNDPCPCGSGKKYKKCCG